MIKITIQDTEGNEYWEASVTPEWAGKHDNGRLISCGLHVPEDLSRRSLDWLRRNGKLRPMARLRWNHSSCLSYVDEWIVVAEEMPQVRFWAPTKAYVIPDILPKLQEFNKLPNVTIRPSGLGLYDSPPVVKGLAGGCSITSDRAVATCRSFDNDDKCGTCRLCWDVPFNTVTYLRH